MTKTETNSQALEYFYEVCSRIEKSKATSFVGFLSGELAYFNDKHFDGNGKISAYNIHTQDLFPENETVPEKESKFKMHAIIELVVPDVGRISIINNAWEDPEHVKYCIYQSGETDSILNHAEKIKEEAIYINQGETEKFFTALFNSAYSLIKQT